MSKYLLCCIKANSRIRKRAILVTIVMSILISSCVSMTPPERRAQQQRSGGEIEKFSIGKTKPILTEKSQIQKVLISNKICSIAVDEHNVWIATSFGVSRFDKKETLWKSYIREDGLASDDVNVVAIDGDFVWFGTDDGVTRYEITSEKFFTFRKRDGLASNHIRCIAVDGNYVWFGTDNGLCRYDKRISSWAIRQKKDGLTSNRITSIAVENGYVWVGTGRGVNRYDRNTDSWNTYSETDGLVDNDISVIAIDEDMVWFCTEDDGISVYSKKDQMFVKTYTKSDLLSSNLITAVVVDGNHIWLGTANGGLQRYIKTVNSWMVYTDEDGLASNHVTSIAVGRNEVWLGTYDSGVSKYDKAANTFKTFVKMERLVSNDVRLIHTGSDEIWVGTPNGLSKYDIESGKYQTYRRKDGLTSDYITAIEKETDGVLWIGTKRGLMGWDREANQWSSYGRAQGLSDEFVTSLAIQVPILGSPQSGNGSFWIGTSDGLYEGKRLRDAFRFTKMAGFPKGFITSIATSGNQLWVGTKSGFFKCDVASNCRKITKLMDGYVNKVIVQSGTVWVGTQAGLYLYDACRGKSRRLPLSNATHFTTKDGLPNDNVRALAADGNVLWIGTPSGLARFASGKCEKVMIEKQSSFSPYSNIRSIVVKGDYLWLGTVGGVIKFDKARNSIKKYQAEVTRTPFRSGGVRNIQLDGEYIWFSNWSDSKNGHIVKLHKNSRIWIRYTKEDLLPPDATQFITDVRRIEVDDDYVWFATDFGVLRYDKKLDTWKHYTIADGLMDNYVREITLSKDSVWARSWDNRKGISRYDKNSATWTTIKLPKEREMDGINCIAADTDSIWVATPRGLLRYDVNMQTPTDAFGLRQKATDAPEGLPQEWKTYTMHDGLLSDYIRFLAVDGNYVWIAHHGGVSRYDKRSLRWTIYPTDVLALDDIRKIKVGTRHVWFLSSYRPRLTGYDREKDEWVTVKLEGEYWRTRVQAIAEDRDYVWIGTNEVGVLRYHKASGISTAFTDDEYIMEDALQSDEDFVLAGTHDGLRWYDKRRKTWLTYGVARHEQAKSLRSDEVRAITVDDEYVWCGANYGISRYDKVHGTWRNFSGIYRITSLAVDDKYLWVGTKSGANRYDKAADRWDSYTTENSLPSEDITAIVVDGYNVWMGTSGGLCQYPTKSDDPNAWVVYTSGVEIKPVILSEEYASSLVSNQVWVVAVDSDYVWVGTGYGVSAYNKRRGTWTTYTHEDGLPSDEISSIAVDGDYVWFGTGRGATKYYKKSREWVNFTTEDGLGSDGVTRIVVDGKDIWFGTFDGGVTRYNQQTGTWTTFTRKDGLSHSTILSMAVDGNYLWVGTPRGLNRYDKTANTWTTYRRDDD